MPITDISVEEKSALLNDEFNLITSGASNQLIRPGVMLDLIQAAIEINEPNLLRSLITYVARVYPIRSLLEDRAFASRLIALLVMSRDHDVIMWFVREKLSVMQVERFILKLDPNTAIKLLELFSQNHLRVFRMNLRLFVNSTQLTTLWRAQPRATMKLYLLSIQNGDPTTVKKLGDFINIPVDEHIYRDFVHEDLFNLLKLVWLFEDHVLLRKYFLDVYEKRYIIAYSHVDSLPFLIICADTLGEKAIREFLITDYSKKMSSMSERIEPKFSYLPLEKVNRFIELLKESGLFYRAKFLK